MTMRFAYMLPLLALPLLGCETTDQCANYGWPPGTVGYAQCRERADLQRQRIIGDYLIYRGAVQTPQVPVYQLPPPATLPTPAYRATTTTSCQRLGQFLNCTTH